MNAEQSLNCSYKAGKFKKESERRIQRRFLPEDSFFLYLFSFKDFLIWILQGFNKGLSTP